MLVPAVRSAGLASDQVSEPQPRNCAHHGGRRAAGASCHVLEPRWRVKNRGRTAEPAHGTRTNRHVRSGAAAPARGPMPAGRLRRPGDGGEHEQQHRELVLGLGAAVERGHGAIGDPLDRGAHDAERKCSKAWRWSVTASLCSPEIRSRSGGDSTMPSTHSARSSSSRVLTCSRRHGLGRSSLQNFDRHTTAARPGGRVWVDASGIRHLDLWSEHDGACRRRATTVKRFAGRRAG
jgi:hypothetical protein